MKIFECDDGNSHVYSVVETAGENQELEDLNHYLLRLLTYLFRSG